MLKEENKKKLKHSIMFGNILLENNIFIAPMAGVTDKAFREIAYKETGVGLIFTEMVSARAISFGDKKTIKMLGGFDNEKIRAVQIFGNDPNDMEKAAFFLDNYAEILDINMGCPAPKVVKTGSGSKLLYDIDLAREIVKRVRSVWKKPLSVKIRIGTTENNINCLDFVKMLNEEKVDLITIHARTIEGGFTAEPNYDIIKKAKNISKVPIIYNGGIFCVEDAKKALEKTNADGIMIARGAMGCFTDIKNIVENLDNASYNISYDKRDSKEKLDDLKRLIKEHFNLMVKYIGEETALREIRKNIIWYSKGIKNSAKIRVNVCKITSVENFNKIIDEFKN